MGIDLTLFGWPLLCLIATTPSLGLIGAQIMSRQQALQVLCIAQGAILGNVLAEWQNFKASWLLAWAVALGVSSFCDWLHKHTNPSSKNSFHVSLYVVLLSATYLLVSYVPSLESHAINQFFGDVVLISIQNAKILFSISVMILFLLSFYFVKLTRMSFEIIVLETKPKSLKKRYANLAFKIGLTLFLTLVIQQLGLLYSLGGLTIIPLVLTQRGASLRSYFNGIIFVSILASFFGLLIALRIEDISTTPVINLSFLFFAFSLRFTRSFVRTYR